MYIPEEVHQLNVRTVTVLGQPAATRPVLTLAPESSISSVTILGYYTIPDPSPTAAGTVNAATTSSSKSSKTPAIIGGTIGGVVLLALVAFLVWFFFRRWRGRHLYSGSRGTTPMLGDHAGEKSGMGETPEIASLRGSGGIFSPFGGELPRAALKFNY